MNYPAKYNRTHKKAKNGKFSIVAFGGGRYRVETSENFTLNRVEYSRACFSYETENGIVKPERGSYDTLKRADWSTNGYKDPTWEQKAAVRAIALEMLHEALKEDPMFSDDGDHVAQVKKIESTKNEIKSAEEEIAEINKKIADLNIRLMQEERDLKDMIYKRVSA